MPIESKQSKPVFKPKYMKLQLPEDVYKALLKEQGIKKEGCSCQFSLQQTTLMMLRRAFKMPEE